MPSKQRRSFLRGAPPLGERACFGNNARVTDQSSSVTKKGDHAKFLSTIPQSAISLYAPVSRF